jgi:hypothetical protein
MTDAWLNVVRRAPWGTHFCELCETSQNLPNVHVPFFQQGLEQDEFCLWVIAVLCNQRRSR